MPAFPVSIRSPLRAASLLSVYLIAVMLCGCTTYRREVSRSGFLTQYSDKNKANGTSGPRKIGSTNPVFMLPEGKIRVEDEEGNVTLYAKSAKHVIRHIIYAIENDERDLFVEQILSEITIKEFEDRGFDPGIAFDKLVEHRRDVYKTFHLMPQGEGTPGLFLKPLGTNMFRLAASRSGRDKLLWIGIDVSFEHGNFKLRWFVR